MIKKIIPVALGLLLIFFSFVVPKSNAMMMKNACGAGNNAGNKMMSKATMMKMHMWMPEMMFYNKKSVLMPFFYKVYPGAHLMFNNRNILKLTPYQARKEAMLVKQMENEAIPIFKILNKTKKKFYVEVNKNNPSVSKLISYEKTFGNAETLLGEKMISIHMKATRLLTHSQKKLLRKLMINWPVVNVTYP